VRRLLVLWDIDFTLIGASGVGQRLYGMVFRDMFGRELPGTAAMAGRTDRAIIIDTLASAGISEPRQVVDQFIARLAALAPMGRELAAGNSRALPGAAAALTALARDAPREPNTHGDTHDLAPPCVVQSVLTGNVRQIAEVKLDAAGLTGHLDLSIGAYGDSHEVRAELVHMARRNATRRYGADFGGDRTVLVGDTELDVAAARATGARVVGVATGGTTADKLAAAGADAVLADLADTPATLAAILGNSTRPAPPLPDTADIKPLLSTGRASPCRPSTDRTTPAVRAALIGKGSIVALHLPSPCQDLLDLQHGVIARWQLAQVGLSVRVADVQLHVGRWQPLYRGAYATFTGRPPRMAVLWAAVLRGGPGAALSYDTAAELDRLIDQPSRPVHVTVCAARQITISDWEDRRACPKIIVHRCTRLNDARHPARMPPRTRIEETTIDLIHVSPNLDQALSWLITACGRRLTTAELLLSAMENRAKLRWRSEITGALTDVGEGVHSLLEWRYVHGVEGAHGLPRATRQARSRAGQRRRYLDNRYKEFAVAVELDGQAAHPIEARWRDIHRDNASAGLGIVTLRYGWADVTEDPCRVAAEVARVLKLHGWPGHPRACKRGCPAALS